MTGSSLYFRKKPKTLETTEMIRYENPSILAGSAHLAQKKKKQSVTQVKSHLLPILKLRLSYYNGPDVSDKVTDECVMSTYWSFSTVTHYQPAK